MGVVRAMTVEIGLKAFVLIFALNMGSSVIKTGRNEGSFLPYIEWFKMQVFINEKFQKKNLFGNL